MVFDLDDDSGEIFFPDPHCGDEDGCLAIGGDLSVERLILAYSHGIFPWYGFREQKDILWWCPMKRFVIFPEEIHISHSLRTLIKKDMYAFTINQCFDRVLQECAHVNGRNMERGAWLGDDMINAYKALHERHYALSVEVWDRETKTLVGGLYGVNIRRVFVGESMFSKVPSASKLALVFLSYYMRERQCTLIDCQLETPHLRSMGGRYISYDDYQKILDQE